MALHTGALARRDEKTSERPIIFALLAGNFIIGTGILLPAGMLTDLAEGLAISGPQLVASNLPVVSGFESGSTWPAPSVNVSITGVFNGKGPPASAIRINLAPFGPTSSTFILSGKLCVTSYSVTRILKTLAGEFITVIVDG